MVPDASDDSHDQSTDDGRPRRSDGGVDPGFDPDTLYRVVRAAIKDALLDVIGTLLLLGVALVIVAMGGQLLLAAMSEVAMVLGALLVLFGLYLGAATLELIPPLREWL
ncbi:MULTISPECIES: hypothetical protein [Halomicrobium]|uniref:Uncharacterized protein n=2 Tax=Halomicrobium mukohataei TaxID=57705 RepID=C7P3T7_HALMD|nr:MULTISPECIES: hypothetical protein [Halomicrobium]ACV47759.1 conserved hypothetical protein [Halomicrobium mukohataei DSM 12286]QCD66210.1 hypothetical protein E5139_11345 [Halomicrobium mukohataei]QFR21015.1 hypothetical protein GBQ70_11340 [Halomicrobium sp. ZPS1]